MLFELNQSSFHLYSNMSQNELKGHFFFNLDSLPEGLVLTVSTGSERYVLRTNFRNGVTYLLDRGHNYNALLPV